MMIPMPYEPTSEEIDRLLAEDPGPGSGRMLAPRSDVRVHLEVPMDAATLRLLQQRADSEGRALADVVSDVVRAGAQAA
jgi:hypothetical protein